MTTDTLQIKTRRVEYNLADVYNAVEKKLKALNAEVAALGVAPSENYAAAMMVSRQKTTQEIFNVLSQWKDQGVDTLVTDTPVCGEGNLRYVPGESLAEQIKSKRLAP